MIPLLARLVRLPLQVLPAACASSTHFWLAQLVRLPLEVLSLLVQPRNLPKHDAKELQVVRQRLHSDRHMHARVG